jgi:hypothetical protein
LLVLAALCSTFRRALALFVALDFSSGGARQLSGQRAPGSGLSVSPQHLHT